MAKEPAESDPFEAWQLDDDFVGGATYQESSAKERAREQRRWAQAQRKALKDRKKYARKHRRASRRNVPRGGSGTYDLSGSSGSKRPWKGILVVVAIGGLLAWNVFLGGDDGARSNILGTAGDTMNINGAVTKFPSRSSEEQDQPIGQPSAAPLEKGSYLFISKQADGSRPVAYDPCRPIHVVINSRTLPIGGDVLVQQALDDISAKTGLHFIVDGPTDEEVTDSRPPVDEDRYGDRWSPVLIVWTDPLMAPELNGTIAGFAGSQEVGKEGGDTVFTTGTVALDGPQFIEVLQSGRGQAEALAIIRHELGHLVGLDHVDDPTEMMYPESTGSNTAFGPGDLAGLNLLGKGECRPDL